MDSLCVSAVTASGAHLAEWGQGDKLYEKADGIFTEQPFRPFVVDGKAIKDRFKLLKNKYEKKEAEGAKSSGTTEEISEMDAMLADACSALNDSKMQAEKAKGEATKEAEALQKAGEAARRAAVVRRVNRRDGGNAEDADAEGEENEEEGKNEGAKQSPAGGPRRRREELEDEKDEELVQVVKKNIAETRALAERRCAADERRLGVEERKVEVKMEKSKAKAAKRASKEAAGSPKAARDAAAAAAERELRGRQLDIMAALMQQLTKQLK